MAATDGLRPVSLGNTTLDLLQCDNRDESGQQLHMEPTNRVFIDFRTCPLVFVVYVFVLRCSMSVTFPPC